MYNPAESFLRNSLSDKRSLFGNVSNVDLGRMNAVPGEIIADHWAAWRSSISFPGGHRYDEQILDGDEHLEDVGRIQYDLGNLLVKNGEYDCAEVVLRVCL